MNKIELRVGGSKLHVGTLQTTANNTKIDSKDEMAKTVIYTRVSTIEQAENKQSLDMQENACRDFAIKKDLDVTKVFREEGESAKTSDRTKLQEMLRFCHENRGKIKYVIVWKVDRFARRTEDHLAMRALLMKLGIQLLSATEPIENTNTGKLMETILAGFAEFDNGVRSERSRNGMYGRAKEGGWVHQAPIGYQNVKDALGRPTLEADDMASSVASFLLEFKKGIYSPVQALELAKRFNIHTKSGKPISANGTYKMLRNPVYAGLIVSSMFTEVVDGLHRGLIGPEDHEVILSILDGRRKTIMPENRAKDRWPLRQFLRCSACGNRLTGSVSRGRTKQYAYYHCTKCKEGTRINHDKAHQKFEESLGGAVPSPQVLKLFKEIVIRRWNEDHKDVQTQRRQIDNRLRECEEARSAIVEKNLKGVFNDELTSEQLDKLSIKKAELELLRSQLHDGELEKEAIVDLAIKFIANTKHLWREADLYNRQRFQKMVFPDGIPVSSQDNFGTAPMGFCYEEINLIKRQDEQALVPQIGVNNTVVSYHISNWHLIKKELLNWYQVLKELPQLQSTSVG